MDKQCIRLREIADEIAQLEKRIEELKKEQFNLGDPAIVTMNISTRAKNALKHAKILRYSDLCRYLNKDPRLEMIRGIGNVTANEIFEKVLGVPRPK